MEQPILAQYTIRSKQSYIFKSNRLLEIVGASAIIRDTFEILLDAADECGFRVRKRDENAKGVLDCQEIMRRFGINQPDANSTDRTDGLDVIELFCGGGNDTLLFRNHEVFRRVNAAYTLRLLREFPGILPLCVGVPVDLSRDNYIDDYDKRLMPKVEEEKNRMFPGRGYAAVPFAKMDRNTFLPYSRIEEHKERPMGERWEDLSDEAYAKRRAGIKEENPESNEAGNNRVKMLDAMTDDEDSLLAIVHADGNNMGIKIQKHLVGKISYKDCVEAMNKFTQEIDTAFQCGKEALEHRQRSMMENDKKHADRYAVRWLVSSGDDATFICNARLAKELTAAYLEGVYGSYRYSEGYQRRYKVEEGVFSSCAGICVFHSHYPFVRAYDLAEQAADTAKKAVHDSISIRADGTRSASECCLLDFHIIHSGIGGDLKDIRANHGTADRIQRPWRVCGQVPSDQGQPLPLFVMDRTVKLLRDLGVSRGNIKTFGAAYEADANQGRQEWNRILYHTPGLRGNPELSSLFPNLFAENAALRRGAETMLWKTLYDIADVYDRWYREEVAAP